MIKTNSGNKFNVDRFKIITVEIPMRFSVSHSLAERDTARNVIVCAHGDNGLFGLGECCPRPYVTGETVESVIENLVKNILPPLIGKTFSSLDELAGHMSSIISNYGTNHHAAFCAAELALLDLAGKTFGISSGNVIGKIVKHKIRYSAVIAANNPDKARNIARLARWYGFKQVKVKVGKSLNDNLAILSRVRHAMGRKADIRIDANCAWDGEEALRQIIQLKRFGINGVEQPVPADDIGGMQHVTSAKITPVIADESLCGVADAENLISQKACDIFNIRVSKCGGMINSAKIHRLAENAGLRCQVGAQVGETAVLSAAGRHLATRCENIIWAEGSYGILLMKADIAKPGLTITPGGWGKSIDTKGLGVTPLKTNIRKFTTEAIEVC